MQITTGQQIKGYELHDRIAAGGFGAVYRAFQSTVGREVAVKIILHSLANKPEFIRRFEAEAQLIARLEHMNIVPLYDYWRDPDGAYLVMRYLRGGSLHDYIREHGKLDIEEAVNMLTQVAQGLHIAHRNQIVHRDIKPSNILLDEDSNAYLGDFGIAKDHQATHSITAPDAFIGSPEYLAPEQARSEPVTPQTDIYSLGVVLYEMLVGEHPFPGVDKVTFIYKHLNDVLPEVLDLDENIRDDINDVIQKATAKDPRQRFKDVAEMTASLRQAAKLDVFPTPANLVELLTPREQEVMQLIIDGKTNREIAEILVLAEGTVKQYISSIYRKLKVRSRVQAIARARDLNFVIRKPEVPISTGHLPEPQNPYKGLGAFQAADAQNFFGRENLTQKLLKRLVDEGEHNRFLTVVGPSGSGKSSVVKAGLIPALWRGDFPGSENWYIIDLLPGAHPIDELEVALFQITADKTINLREQLERDARGLVRVANMVLPDDGSELLIVIDQFEEVFTLVNDEPERRHLLRLLRESVTDPRSRVRIITTLRADYYDRPLQYTEIADLIRDRVETVLPLSAEELEQAISEPANQQGVTFEDGLVSRIVSDVHYQPGSLPLLQYALTELFERRSGRELTLQAYHEIGGTGGALANRADEVYQEYAEEGQELIRQLFLRLVTLGEGAEDTRRRVERSELLEITSNKDLMDEVIDHYADSRLLSLDHDPGSRRPTVEVAHEAILREWERLRQWLNNSREDIRQQRLVAGAAEAWESGKRDNSYLLTGTRLEQAHKWCEKTELALTPLEKDYIRFSLEEAQAKELAQTRQLERESALERRSQTILRLLVGVFAVAAIVAIGLSIVAVNFGAEASRERDNAEENFLRAERIRLAAQAQIALDRGEDVRIPALLALRSLELGYSPEADGALLQALSRTFSRQTYIGHTGQGITGVSFINDNNRILTSSTDGTVRMWDTFSGEELRRFVGHVGNVSEFRVFPDEETLLTGGDDGTIRLWNLNTGEEVEILLDMEVRIRNLDLSPNGSLLATSDQAGGLSIWEVDGMALRFELIGHTELVNQLEFSADGTILTSASNDGTVKLWDMRSGQIIQDLDGHAAGVWATTFSPDGRLIATASIDRTLRLWDSETGEEVQRFIGHTGVATNIVFSPNGQVVASSGPEDLEVFLWNVASGQQIRKLDGHSNGGTVLTFSSDGQYLLSGSLDSVPRLWIMQDETEPRLFTRVLDSVHANTIRAASLSDGNEHLSTVSDNGVVRIWSVSQQTVVDEFVTMRTNPVSAAAVSNSQQFIVTGTNDGDVDLWDATTGEQIRQYTGHTERITSVKFSETSRMFITGSDDNDVILWTIDDETPVIQFTGHNVPITDVAISQDEHLVISSSEDGTVILWNVENGAEIRRYAVDNEGIVLSVALSPDGRFLLTGCDDNTAQVWDVESGEMIQQFVGHTGEIEAVRFSENGQIAMTGSRDTTVRFWDIATGETIRAFIGQNRGIQTLYESSDGKFIVTGDENSAYLWHANLQDVIELACEKIPSDFTPEERDLYQITDDYEACDQRIADS
ncbi:MAG: protein kinase [Aggregatilineales bacterium]